MRISISLLLMLMLSNLLLAQDSLISKIEPLQEVVVTAFNARTKWKETPAAIAVVNQQILTQFAPTSILPALNMVSGVRMEERSPGSYRLSVRGSLLRSPFGIRNVKVYWNDIPFSDATGNTYLNLMHPSMMDQIEIAKGPASSMYGSGTGGVFLLNRSIPFADSSKQKLSIALTGGSFGYQQQLLQFNHQKKQFSASLQLHRLQSDGYREQSALKREGLFWQTAFQIRKHLVKTGLFYTNLFYQTPGGITAAQMLLNPKLSRQAVGALPSAKTQNASIQNNTIWAGIHDQYQINQQASLKHFLSINHTSFINPFITNYETRSELNMAAGIQLAVQPKTMRGRIKWITGAEYLANESLIRNAVNNGGVEGNLFLSDRIYTQQGFVFTQLQVKPNDAWSIQTGISINSQSYQFRSLLTANPLFTKRRIQSPISPRLAINFTINQQMNVYGILSHGFSAPSLAEIRPSDGNFYPFLNAEQGWNKELGIKGSLANNRLVFDVNMYFFQLKDAIVRRNDNIGNDYFINAGATKQNGIEAMVKFILVPFTKARLHQLSLMQSFSYQPYQFSNYQQGNNNFNGNPITGVPKYIWVASLNYQHKNGWQWNINANLTSKISLNDAATVYANGYQLLQTKLSKQWMVHQKPMQVFLGVDNLLDQVYSLGNDINAAGNRFFNPAPSRNMYIGVQFNFQ